LVISWLIFICMRIDVKCLQMITIDYSTNSLFSIRSTIRFKSWFTIVILKLRVRKKTRKWNLWLNVISNFIFIYAFSLLLFFFLLLLFLSSLLFTLHRCFWMSASSSFWFNSVLCLTMFLWGITYRLSIKSNWFTHFLLRLFCTTTWNFYFFFILLMNTFFLICWWSLVLVTPIQNVFHATRVVSEKIKMFSCSNIDAGLRRRRRGDLRVFDFHFGWK